MKLLSKVALASAAGGAVAGAVWLKRRRTERPPYELLNRAGRFELRRYPPRVVAETDADGEEDLGESEGYGRLARYVSGDNSSSSPLPFISPLPTTSGHRIRAPIPFEQGFGTTRRTITMTMPAQYEVQHLPTPLNARVRLRAVPMRVAAVLRFTGRADRAKTQAYTRELLAELDQREIAPKGTPSLVQYDPPWMMGPVRRNEILVPIG